MKMMIPMISLLLLFKKNINLIFIILIYSIIMMMSMLNMKFPLISNIMLFDKLSLIMMMLTLISVTLIFLSTSNMKKIFLTISMILLILMMTFFSKNMLLFYIMFELVLIPTMILITMNGKQPERLQASMYLIMYTIFTSLPLLIMIIMFKTNSSFTLSTLLLYKYSFIMFIMLAFLIKMPMYMTHLWLPKAHVEAPLEGSMILAAILLKLGGYGIIRFIPMCIKMINKMNYWIISISLIGATTTSMNCIRQKDLKSLIAYSSVAHMGFVLCSLFTMNSMGMMGAIIMMIAHGMSSSALFLLVNDLYYKYHTRNILMFKGLFTLMPNMTFWWFMFMSLNISAPPTINTFSEIMMMSSILSWNINSMIIIFMMSLMTASFSLMMFVNIIHNKNKMLISNNTSNKIFLSLMIHIIPTLLMVLKMDLISYYMSSLNKTMFCGNINSFMYKMFIFMVTMSLFYFMLSMYLINLNKFILMKYSLIKFMSIMLSIDIMMDWMSLMFLSTIMFISSLIILFSTYYIPNKQQKLFLLLLMMFVLSMKILIISNNMFLILLGWDGLGLSSYILVIYYQNFSSASSGTITLLSNRIGDILILLSMSMMILMSNWSFSMNLEYPMIIMIMLMIAACTKSAQLPFSAWLPMAMAAPTPISALVHSSTLVTAGVFILLRIMTNIHPITMIILLVISSLTTIYSSMSANWEQDMKKIIALSTLSQIAMMMFAISMNLMMLAYIHLIIHALFKSAMFLCAGIMIHESSYQDMRMMGTMFINSPLTLTMLGINSMSLMGIPFMSGFFSKDLIIESMISSKTNFMMLILMIMSIGMTASYSMRMSFFSSKNLLKSSKLMSNHQSNKSFIPIMMLSLLAITSGSWMTWLLSPTQMFIISYKNKMYILILLSMGMMMGFTLQFKNIIYMKMGMSSISLWFTHHLSTIMTNYSFPIMQMFQNNDKNWQEKYGPQLIYNMIIMKSYSMEKIKSYLMMIIIMMTLIPIFML